MSSGAARPARAKFGCASPSSITANGVPSHAVRTSPVEEACSMTIDAAQENQRHLLVAEVEHAGHTESIESRLKLKR